MTKAATSLDSIPTEIWEAIFAELSLKNRFTCQYVCKTWYLPARRTFLEHVTLQTVYEVEQFLQCFLTYAEPFSFSFIKQLTIGHTYTMPSRARLHLKSEAVSQLIHHFPNIQQLEISDNCIDLTYFTRPETISSVINHWPLLRSFGVNRVLIQAEKRQVYLETMHQLRHCMTRLTLYKMNDPALFVASFPQLRHLTISPQDGMENLQDCLSILDLGQPLESLSVFTKKNDTGSFLQRYQGERSIDQQRTLAHKLMAIKTLKLTSNTFCVNTMRFVAQHLTGLSALTLGFVSNNVDKWTIQQRNYFKDEFLDFLCLRRQYLILHIKFNYNGENHFFTRAIAEKHYQRQAEAVHTKTLDRHAHIVCFNNHLRFGTNYNNILANESKFSFELKSEDISSKILRRTATLTHVYEKTYANDILATLDSILSVKGINKLIFDVSNLCILAEDMPGLFTKVMTRLPQADAITVHLPRSYQQLNLFNDSFVYDHVNTLEIIGGSLDPLSQDTLHCASVMFPRLKYLTLWAPCGYWLLKEKSFVVDMRRTSLEHVHLDSTSVRVKSLNEKKLSQQPPFLLEDLFFVLQVSLLHEKKELYFRVSLDYLRITKLEKADLVGLLSVDDEYITVKLVFRSLGFLTLYLNQEIYHDVDPLFTCLDKRKMVQSSLLFSES